MLIPDTIKETLEDHNRSAYHFNNKVSHYNKTIYTIFTHVEDTIFTTLKFKQTIRSDYEIEIHLNSTDKNETLYIQLILNTYFEFDKFSTDLYNHWINKESYYHLYLSDSNKVEIDKTSLSDNSINQLTNLLEPIIMNIIENKPKN